MFKNSILGRVFAYWGCPPEDDGHLPPEPSLTISALIICIGGPFWLIYELIKSVVESLVSVFRKIGQRMERVS